MNKKHTENPFPVNKYMGSDYFCDRKTETEQLITNMLNGNSTMLFSIRRMGKTGLVSHTLNQLPQGWQGVYLDILATENLNQFLNQLSTAIINAVPEKSSFGKRIWSFVKSLRPTITFDSLTGEPQASFDIKRKEVESNITNVFQFLEKQDFNVLIVIDEFQQILNYPEENTDAWLRTIIQKLKNVVFIFSGSQQHLMLDLFTSPKRPFYRSTQMLKLEKINKEVYRDFIISMFKKYGKKIDPSLASDIIEWANTHTYFVQAISNRVFSATEKVVTEEIWKQQAHQLLHEQETLFLSYRSMLTYPQWQLLKALATEEKVYKPTSKKFLDDYKLGTSATVLRSLNTLQGYELIYNDFDSNGEKYFSVYDVLLQRWCKG